MTQFDLLRLAIRESSGRLSPTQKAVLIHLIDRANSLWQCWPSQSLLSEQTGFSTRTIKRTVFELTKAGFISVVSSGKGRAHSNTYSINVDAITQLSEQGSHSDEVTESQCHSLDEEEVTESPLLGEEMGTECHLLGNKKVTECHLLDEEVEKAEGNLFPALGTLCPPLGTPCPSLVTQCHFNGDTVSHKEIQEEIQEEIHEDRRRTKLKGKEIDPDNTGHSSEDQQRFMLPPDWMPNNHLLMEQAKQRNLEGLFNLNQHYRGKMLNKFKNQYSGKKGVCKTAEEWHQVFCKSIEVQLRIDGVAV